MTSFTSSEILLHSLLYLASSHHPKKITYLESHHASKHPKIIRLIEYLKIIND